MIHFVVVMERTLMERRKKKEKRLRGHPGLNRGPLDLQSNALPLSYTPDEHTSAADASNGTA